ncbi:hypothetical protein HDU96_001742 [Phlyctochytrium bullatum]|nr:hypothetical protein HDU96_001742 [Phlyctochytrium bullatum]
MSTAVGLPKTPKTIFITGASTGIGAATALAFARKYARPPLASTHALTLVLTARRVERLNNVRDRIAAECPGVKVHVLKLDVTDSKEVFDVFSQAVALTTRIDVVLVNSGISDGGAVGGWDSHTAQEACIRTNVIGAMATVNAAVDHMRATGAGGHIVGIGSVAAYRGCPGIAAYGASKAALHTYLEAVAAEVGKYKIKVSTIHPGFIDTDINKDAAYRPFLITSQRGGEIVMAHIERKTSLAIIPFFPWAFVARLMSLMPAWLIGAVWGSELGAKK